MGLLLAEFCFPQGRSDSQSVSAAKRQHWKSIELLSELLQSCPALPSQAWGIVKHGGRDLNRLPFVNKEPGRCCLWEGRAAEGRGVQTHPLLQPAPKNQGRAQGSRAGTQHVPWPLQLSLPSCQESPRSIHTCTESVCHGEMCTVLHLGRESSLGSVLLSAQRNTKDLLVRRQGG